MAIMDDETYKEKDTLFNELIERFKIAESVFELEDLKTEFEELGDFRDAKNFAKECDEKISLINEEKLNIDYQMYVRSVNKAKTAEECDRYKAFFDSLGDYKSARYYSNLCTKVKDEILTTEAFKAQDARVKSYEDSIYDLKRPVSSSGNTSSGNRTSNPRKRIYDPAKKLEDANTNAKIITLVFVLLFRIPAIFLGLCLFVLAVDHPGIFAVLLFGIILDILKIAQCIMAFQPFYCYFEENFWMVSWIRNIEITFIQTCVRLFIHAAISIAYFIFASACIISAF